MDITRSSPAPVRVVAVPPEPEPEPADLTALPEPIAVEPLQTLPATATTATATTATATTATATTATATSAITTTATATDVRGRRNRPRPRDLLALLRPGQWVKNLAVVPLALLDTHPWGAAAFLRTGWAVLGFTLASALVYVVNDLADRERDRLHPVKRHRPIASGRVSTLAAVVLTGALALALTGWAVAGPAWQWWPTALYLALSLAYSQGLKHVPLVDAFIVATGFVLRLVQGALLVGAQMSEWLALCVFSLCLMLALGKRRHEMTAAGRAHRPALRGYTLAFLDHLVVLVAVLTAVSYVLYLRDDASLAAGASLVTLLSAPCAVFGLARYLQLLLVEEGGGNPVHVLFRDRATLVNAALWAVLVALALLLPQSPA
ncbi:UbiA prenyltransferase family protein [Streptomyces sp. W4I9-2]|uniref:UbiA prenyltransferase family protein n=1 Tax=Streptomyces sp. W4I9-2 TaxID=3042297 RepID=UPI0027808A77|nr:UbiA prenyltransferase family protein [Streptomyces sp. W4I9-2]MDQ0695903.1 decaprenyl-phosphate phosphoribosyltransferase [Streptomyces sp. W4I9-2]